MSMYNDDIAHREAEGQQSLGMSFMKFGELMLKVQQKSFYGNWIFTFSKGQILAFHKEHGEYGFNSFVELEKWING